MSVSSYATNLVELIGLGLAIDYSLLIVCRFREELAQDDSTDAAIVRTMTGAGRAVVFSGPRSRSAWRSSSSRPCRSSGRSASPDC